ncbi:MAG: heat-inducible transcription repressor HrcA [Chloroflexi bacterium]|nr:heat-inducible transcription repressor HrcA [Chloroflexota bacterium]
MLSPRQEAVLRFVIAEYVDTSRPVGSATIARKCALGVSPATIRGDMAELEEAGLLTHLHTSAGRVPSARGYRHYVEFLMEEPRLPADDRHRILHQFHQVEREAAEWTRLAAAILANTVQNVAVVTVPTVSASRLKRLDVIPVSDRRAWLVAVLHGGLLKQQLLFFDEPAMPEDLAAATRSLNRRLLGRTASAIDAALADAPSMEQQIGRCLIRLMAGVDRQRYDVCLEGLRALLDQPEFKDPDRLRHAVELLSEPRTFLALLPPMAGAEGIQVSIGGQAGIGMLEHLSIVVTGYGIPGEVGGMLAVLGPTRMHYARAISATRYVADVLSDLLRNE